MANKSFLGTTTLQTLLAQADQHGASVVWVYSENQLALGNDPFNPTYIVELGAEALRPVAPNDALPPPTVPTPRGRPRRDYMRYFVAIRGERMNSSSLKELLSDALLGIEEVSPGTLDELTKVKPRTKRIVARDPSNLCEQKELVKQYAAKLTDGWWYGTNNNLEETLTWIQRAAKISALEWGKDIQTNIG